MKWAPMISSQNETECSRRFFGHVSPLSFWAVAWESTKEELATFVQEILRPNGLQFFVLSAEVASNSL